MTADILIMGVSNEDTGNYRKLSEKKISILLVEGDPRMRVVLTSYMALIDKNRLNDKLSPNAS